MLNRSASLAMSTCVLKALPGKLDIERHSPSILYFQQLPSDNPPFHIIDELPDQHNARASDFFQDWWAEVTHGAKNGGSFSEMMGPSISN